MDARAQYIQAGEAYRIAHKVLAEIAARLVRSSAAKEQALGSALLKHPERIKLEGLPHGTGVSFEAHFVQTSKFDVKGWPLGPEIANAILARTQARMTLDRAYERVSFSERAGISKPSDIIDNVD